VKSFLLLQKGYLKNNLIQLMLEGGKCGVSKKKVAQSNLS
jgi:hypothetical protein